ncbi:MBL fold metallo-hydrolase [Tuberibacillus sp. Marseille-P3662]|uniref:MBL fold metallo-hydrolase n=1 Tax=Tuberibacillus sp. Marseille-P3662 TaxID=1965358 RepID=UPI000A1C808D|nr:MBL fold metallo-hydrolase [Tuberibacillus sp. Marseille-P3662]
MSVEKIGPIEIIMGETKSKVPFSTSLLLGGENESVLIDCGGGRDAFAYLTQKDISTIYLTHYHLDHIWGAHLFPNANVSINPYDLKKICNPYELAKASGQYALYGKEKAQRQVEHQCHQSRNDELKPRWGPVINIADDCYAYDQPIEVAGTTMTMLHTPGHTEGFCCPYFPEYGVLFVGDYDLTSFGPWYNDADSDINDFIASAKRTLETDAEYFVTAHHKGSFSRQAYQERLQQYIDKIYEREEKTKQAVQRGVQPKDIVYEEIFYFRKNHRQNRHYLGSEILGIAKHIERLIAQGYDFVDYFEQFRSHFHLDIDFLDYRSQPDCKML